MNGRKARAAHQAARAAAPVRAPGARGRTVSWKMLLAGLGAGAVLAGSFVVPGLLDATDEAAVVHAGMAAGVGLGEGLPAGSPVPRFAERDIATGIAISSESVFPRKTLLFFSEGIMCQACLQQIKGIEDVGDALGKRGIDLVSITPDSASDLRRARSSYGIETPLIADEDGDMSAAFNTIGQGMHGDAPGHAFALVSQGKVLWYRDYWLAPTRSMYVDPERLLADIASGST